MWNKGTVAPSTDHTHPEIPPTTVATVSWSTFEGTLRVFCSYFDSNYCACSIAAEPGCRALQSNLKGTLTSRGGGGHSNVKGGYLARPKIHVIRVVFQDQALYVRTWFRGAKTCKTEKRVCFWSYGQILERT